MPVDFFFHPKVNLTTGHSKKAVVFGAACFKCVSDRENVKSARVIRHTIPRTPELKRPYLSTA